MTIYLFFAYVKRKDNILNFPMVKKYLEEKERCCSAIEYGKQRVLYAYTSKKVYRDLFMMERDMKRFGGHPTKVKIPKDRFDHFEQHHMGRELELRGIANHRILPTQGATNILGTCDEFSFVMYEYFSAGLLDDLDLNFPISDIFKKKYRKAMRVLKYPFESLSDFVDGYGWFDLENSSVLDEASAFVNAFGNLYRKDWEDFIK